MDRLDGESASDKGNLETGEQGPGGNREHCCFPVVGDFILNFGESFTWADDLTIMIASEDMSSLHMQIGGYTDFGASYRFTWPTGASGDPGTHGGGTIDIGGIDCSGYYVWMGNGYSSGGDGNWTGDIYLEGISYVPAPGAIALLGLGGLVARRRRA